MYPNLMHYRPPAHRPIDKAPDYYEDIYREG